VVLLDDALDPRKVLASARAKGLCGAEDEEALREAGALVGGPREAGAAVHKSRPPALRAMLDAIDLDAPSVMLYTSGPRATPRAFRCRTATSGSTAATGCSCNGRSSTRAPSTLLWLPLSHIFGFGELCLGNTLGFTTYMSDPASVLSKLPEVKPDVFMSVPAYWEKIAMARGRETRARSEKLAASRAGRLRFCLSGGAGLKREVKELFHACGLLIIEGYGLTECSPTLTLNRPDAFRFDSVGKVPCPRRAAARRRRRDPREGPQRLRGLPQGRGHARGLHRGRVVQDRRRRAFTEDGFLQIIDRKKDILVTAGGKNVPPANIELRFAGDPLFAHVVVYGDGRRYLVAGVWLDPARRRGGSARAGRRRAKALRSCSSASMR
jgi:long-chain acyl-CoA synthetase